jgi:hypothetical protein
MRTNRFLPTKPALCAFANLSASNDQGRPDSQPFLPSQTLTKTSPPPRIFPLVDSAAVEPSKSFPKRENKLSSIPSITSREFSDFVICLPAKVTSRFKFFMSSEAQIRANQANAKLSPGPVTALGKSVCSRNALKHALSGARVTLPYENLEEFNNFVAMIFKQFRPQTDMERYLIQTIAETEWRLRRIPRLESAAYTTAADDESGNASYAKELSSLGLHETRLQRKLEKKTAEFEKLRREREMVQTTRLDHIMETMLNNPITGQPNASQPHPSIGSEFSWPYMVGRITFKKYAPQEDIAVFDRCWPDKSAKTSV